MAHTTLSEISCRGSNISICKYFCILFLYVNERTGDIDVKRSSGILKTHALVYWSMVAFRVNMQLSIMYSGYVYTLVETCTQFDEKNSNYSTNILLCNLEEHAYLSYIKKYHRKSTS